MREIDGGNKNYQQILRRLSFSFFHFSISKYWTFQKMKTFVLLSTTIVKYIEECFMLYMQHHHNRTLLYHLTCTYFIFHNSKNIHLCFYDFIFIYDRVIYTDKMYKENYIENIRNDRWQGFSEMMKIV